LFVCAWFFHFFTYFAFQIQTSNQAFSFRKLDFQLSIIYLFIYLFKYVLKYLSLFSPDPAVLGAVFFSGIPSGVGNLGK